MPLEIKSPYPLWALIRDSGTKGFQFLNECLNGTQKVVKQGTQITFIGDVPLMDLLSNKPGQVGLIVWIDGERFREIQAAVKENRPANLEPLDQ